MSSIETGYNLICIITCFDTFKDHLEIAAEKASKKQQSIHDDKIYSSRNFRVKHAQYTLINDTFFLYFHKLQSLKLCKVILLYHILLQK